MRIGITGHQRLKDPTAWNWVTEALERLLDRMSVPLIAVTSLAVGADQLFARLVLNRGGKLYAVIPFHGIERTFAPEDLPSYQHLIDQAEVEVLTAGSSDEESFLAAGQRVADLADLMIAVWDGAPAKGLGGTADIVAYTVGHEKPLVHVNPITRQITESGRAPVRS